MVKYFALIFLVSGLLCWGQNDLSAEKSIQNLIQLEKKDIISNSDIDAMLGLIKEFFPEKPDEALIHLSKVRRFIEKNNYQDGLLDYCLITLKIYRIKTEVHKAEKIIREIDKKYKDKFTQENRVTMGYLLADITNYNKDFEKSLKIAKRALPDAVTVFQKASLNYVIAANYLEIGNHQEALSHCLKALELYKSDKDDKNTGLIYNLMSVIYQEIKDFEKGKHYGKLSLRYAQKANNLNNILDTYSNLVVSYRGLNQIDSAKYIFHKIIEISTRSNRPYITAQARLNMGNLYSDEGDFEKAHEQFRMSLALCHQYKINEGILYNHINLGTNYQNRGMYAASLMALDSAVYYAELVNAPPFIMSQLYDGYITLHEKTGDYKKAFANYKIKDSIDTAMNAEETKKAVAEIQGKYDTALKDAEIARINQEFQIEKSEKKALVYLIIIGVVLTASVILFLVYRNNQLKLLYKKNIEVMNIKQFLGVENEELNSGSNPTLKKIFDEIIHLLEAEKVYQNPNLTINDVTQAINSNQKYVSSAIANYTQMNFNNFINYFRISEAKRLIISQEYQTLNEIMYASGFNSRTPFYNAFNKFTGMSPRQFKDLSKSEPQSLFETKDDVSAGYSEN